MNKRMPAFFIAHGSPLNIILDNDYTNVLKNIKNNIDEPKAILIISAHWKTRGAYVNISQKPKQIYDFYGFPEELYNIKYEPLGAKDYGHSVADKLKEFYIKTTEEWGLDHGAWGILKHIYPEADIPVFQLSLNGLKDNKYHYELGKKLSFLRNEGVLILGSGNIVHNLMRMKDEMYSEPHSFAVDFEKNIKDSLINNRHEDIINYNNLGQIAKLSVPTDEHFLPLLYLIGMQEEDEKAEFIYEGFQNGSMSMTCIKIETEK